jgi:hypothetical protein
MYGMLCPTSSCPRCLSAELIAFGHISRFIIHVMRTWGTSQSARNLEAIDSIRLLASTPAEVHENALSGF